MPLVIGGEEIGDGPRAARVARSVAAGRRRRPLSAGDEADIDRAVDVRASDADGWRRRSIARAARDRCIASPTNSPLPAAT